MTEECLECGSAICPCVWEKIQLKDKLFAEKGFEVADLQEQRDTAWGRIMGLEAELKLSVGSVCTITRKVDSLEIRWKPSDLGRYRYIEARVEGLSLELNRRDEFIASLDAALKKVTLERDHLMTLICLASQEE